MGNLRLHSLKPLCGFTCNVALMAGTRFFVLKSIRQTTSFIFKSQWYRSYDCTERIHLRSLGAFSQSNKETQSHHNIPNTISKISCCRTKPTSIFSPTLLPSYSRRTVSFVSVSLFPKYCSYSFSSSSNADKVGNHGVPAASGVNGDITNTTGNIGINWSDKFKDLWKSALDAANYSGQKVQEASNELSPYVEQLLDSHPYLKDVVVPVSITFTAAILAWLVMPRLLRRFHKYAIQGPTAFLSRNLSEEEVPYEKSIWSALEDPVRYVITFMAFSQIATLVAPTTIASQYLPQAWRGAIILSFVWFLQRWKTNLFARALASTSVADLDRDKLLVLDKILSVGLFGIGLMTLAEACGVAVQSIITVGGIGGVATAFAARDILGNVLSGLALQFSKPFSLGDTIKAGAIEGQVMEMGLTSTILLNAEKFPIIVPNSLFSSQAIMNKSRAGWRATVNKIPIQVNDLDKVPEISNDIKSMMRSHSKVFLEKEAPYCFLSRIESSFAELTLVCNLRHMSKEELYSTQQEILLRSVQIIKQHGAMLGSSFQDMT